VQCYQDSQCTSPAYPACLSDIDAGFYCVGCTMPTQCPAATPGCNSNYLSCGSCSIDADCPAAVPLCGDAGYSGYCTDGGF
jgi:hypothetical protein